MGVLASLAIVAPACRHLAPENEPVPVSEAVLEVDNQAFLDMTIYVVRSGTRQRIGIAPGHTRTSFSLRRGIVSQGADLQFLADPIGGHRTPVSQRIYVSPGDVVQLTITP
jgi:hypothetical protein